MKKISGMCFFFSYSLIIAAILLSSCGSVSTVETTLIAETATATQKSQAQRGSPVTEEWFFEDFYNGIPSNWLQSGSWITKDDLVYTDQSVETLYIPGEWQDMILKARVKHMGSGWAMVGFRVQGHDPKVPVVGIPDSYLELSFDSSNFLMGRKKAGDSDSEPLGANQFAINSDWHELVITARGENIVVEWDGQVAIIAHGADDKAKGGIFIGNSDGGVMEVDWVEVSPITEESAELMDAQISALSSGITTGSTTGNTPGGSNTTGGNVPGGVNPPVGAGNPSINGYDLGIVDIVVNGGKLVAIIQNFGLPLNGLYFQIKWNVYTQSSGKKNTSSPIYSSLPTGGTMDYFLPTGSSLYQNATTPVAVEIDLVMKFVDSNLSNNQMGKVFSPPVVAGGSSWGQSMVDLAVTGIYLDSSNQVVSEIANVSSIQFNGSINFSYGFSCTNISMTYQTNIQKDTVILNAGSSTTIIIGSYASSDGDCMYTNSITTIPKDSNSKNNSLTQTINEPFPSGGGTWGQSPTETPAPPPSGGGSWDTSPTETSAPPPSGGGSWSQEPTPTPTIEIVVLPVIIVIPP
jgi:hypothetical protein